MFTRFLTTSGYFAIALVCLSVASADDKQDKNALIDKLAGVWILDSVEIKGEKRQGKELPARFQGMKQTVKGDQMIVSRADGEKFECRLVASGKTEPFELDIIQSDRDGKHRTSKCIYKIIGQKLILAEGKDERPTSFETSSDVNTKVSTFTLER
jgi:uncharacterized protein (TIGR03067 family)